MLEKKSQLPICTLQFTNKDCKQDCKQDCSLIRVFTEQYCYKRSHAPEECRKCLTMLLIPDGATKCLTPSCFFSPSMIPLNGTSTLEDNSS